MIFNNYENNWLFMKYIDIILSIAYLMLLINHIIFKIKHEYNQNAEYYINIGWIMRTIIVLIILYEQLVLFITDMRFDLNFINIFLTAIILIPFEYSIFDACKLKQLFS